MKTTKFDVIQLIVESEQASPETFKPIFLTAIAHGAKEVYNAQADVKHVKPLIDSASYLISQIEDVDIRIMLESQPKWIKRSNEMNALLRQKRQYIETLTTVLNKL
jgi:predicted metal-dependent phosphoesterase TrpH